MIPLHDINPTRGRALVTYGLIAACFLVFFYELTLEATGGGEQGLDAFFLRWGAIPSRINDAIAHGQWFSQATFGLVSSQLLHAGWLHILGLWFVLQLITGVASLGAPSAAEGGVATFAHVGGFVMGMAVGALLRARQAPPGRVG